MIESSRPEAEEFRSEADRVAQRLRDEIIDGVRQPGSRLVEREIATEVGLSRIPVRDALRMLVAEGLAVARPRTWAVVREFTAADIADLDEVRSAFERLAFRLAAERRTETGLQRLRDLLDAEWAAARSGDGPRARRSAADFHQLVTELAGNALLYEMEQNLRSRMRWLLSQHDDLEAVAAEHEDLYDAIAGRDVDAVTELVAHHLEGSRARALDRIEGR